MEKRTRVPGSEKFERWDPQDTNYCDRCENASRGVCRHSRAATPCACGCHDVQIGVVGRPHVGCGGEIITTGPQDACTKCGAVWHRLASTECSYCHQERQALAGFVLINHNLKGEADSFCAVRCLAQWSATAHLESKRGYSGPTSAFSRFVLATGKSIRMERVAETRRAIGGVLP